LPTELPAPMGCQANATASLTTPPTKKMPIIRLLPHSCSATLSTNTLMRPRSRPSQRAASGPAVSGAEDRGWVGRPSRAEV
jgi:hypothetical protein